MLLHKEFASSLAGNKTTWIDVLRILPTHSADHLYLPHASAARQDCNLLAKRLAFRLQFV